MTDTTSAPYDVARGLANVPFADAVGQVRAALLLDPGDPDMNALRLWLGLRRHVAGDRTIAAVNRALATIPLFRRPVSEPSAFDACVLAREATLAQTESGRFFRYATIAQACGAIAFWSRYRRSLTVRQDGRAFALSTGGRRLALAAEGPQLGLHMDFFFVHEPGMWAWISEFTPDDVLLDVGANVGLYSVGAAALRGCRVVGLEPFPVNVRTARANVTANGLDGLVEIMQVAATARSGDGLLGFEDEVPGVAAQAFHPGDDPVPAGADGLVTEGVAIDDLVSAGAIPFPTRIKIDVDGGEDAVIAGMQATLADPRLDSVRLEVRWWQPGKQALVDAVCRHGFRSTVHDDRKNLLFRRV